jgi:hypothetical protein
MRLLKALLLVAGGLAVPGSVAQAQELPDYTTEQRWDRAAMHVTLFAVVILRQGMEAGSTPSDVARTLVNLVGSGWSGVTTPFAMGRAIHRNWALWPGGDFAMQEAADGGVSIRMNRPYTGVFGDAQELLGVTLHDFETMFRSFHEMIAEQQGMRFSQTEDAEGLTVAIGRR